MFSWLRCRSLAGPLFALVAGMTMIARAVPLPAVSDVFVGGREGFAVYRIPSVLATRDGSLLAFAEARATKSDQSRNQLVVKRSRDAGVSWEPLRVVTGDGIASLNNPTAVLVRETGRILLMYQRYPPGLREGSVVPGLAGTNVCTSWLVYSDDDGVTWSPPRDLTAAVKRPTGATSLASGPGIGIQLQRGPHAGRILIPFNQGPPRQWRVYAAWSDDQGATWQRGDPAPDAGRGHGNEVQFVELTDGSVLLNARNEGGDRQRKTALSRDGGRTWSALADEPQLPEPVCQAALIRHPDRSTPGREVLLFANPGTRTGRTNGTVRLSRDDGRTWPWSAVIYPGSFAYSGLVSLPDGAVGCLFERDNYDRISWCRFTLDRLAGAAGAAVTPGASNR